MTVCVAVAVNDCLVFAADSAASIVTVDPQTGEDRILSVYQNGDKVYNLHKALPICAMTCGMGNIGRESIATIAKRLRKLITEQGDFHVDPSNYSIEEIAEKARRFIFEDRFGSLPNPPLGSSMEFWIGGYSSDLDMGHEVWKVAIINGECPPPERIVSDGETKLVWGGQPAPINRLILGFDPAIEDCLRAGGLGDDDVLTAMQSFKDHLARPLVLTNMPVRDAIDLADFLVDTTKRFFRFLPGADIVGGDTDIAVVTRYEGFKWIARKHFYATHLNPLETGHV
ncbi:hypothetical protein [Aureimonas glaciei]|uniref:Uncharacterized protein n=1 Tax=Aureimonas glaciei TaxID=1776957 RepID=A0A917DBB7_9HYPH|nr:hypothetical protein [Aureimonas glaciei]GGD22390.1 hypothetical protein GCM10011335_26600 [Aureimonas glaciei]